MSPTTIPVLSIAMSFTTIVDDEPLPTALTDADCDTLGERTTIAPF